MALMSLIFTEQLLPSFNEDALCSHLHALTARLRLRSGGARPRMEYLRSESGRVPHVLLFGHGGVDDGCLVPR